MAGGALESTVAAPASDAAPSRYVAVSGDAPPGAAELAPAAERRSAVRRQVHLAGQGAAIDALGVPGAALLCLWPLGVWSLAGATAPAWVLAWGLLAPAVATAMLRLPRWLHAPPQRRHPLRPWARRVLRPALMPAFWPPTLALAATLLAALPWLAAPPTRPALAGACMLWAALAATALAPWRRLALSVAWLPLLAGFGAAQTADAGLANGWLAAGAAGTLATLLGAWARHRSWRLDTRVVLALQARAQVLEAERDHARRSDQDKSRFVAIASHDLRQPVHALGLFAATLQKRLQHTPDEALVRNFLRAVDDLERSFSSMLDISRLDGSSATPSMHSFPLRDLFRRLQMQYAGQAELSGLGLRFSTGGKSVTSDPQLLERIIGNLVQNAIKYTTHGGVVVVARSTATHVNVEVWDTGPGIVPTELPRIFQEFYQVAPGRRDRSHGLGMGLAIVKRLAQLLGHRLEVASRPGRGTMFRVGIAIGTLPGIQDELAPADTRPMAADSPQMVLIVEDEEPIREGLRVLLQEWGYQTITAASAAEAEQAVLALEGRVDLVLSDLQLGHRAGDPDGIAVVERVRRLCGYAVPAVIVTGDTSAQAAQALAARGDPVLFKPVQPRRLFDAMRAALG